MSAIRRPHENDRICEIREMLLAAAGAEGISHNVVLGQARQTLLEEAQALALIRNHAKPPRTRQEELGDLRPVVRAWNTEELRFARIHSLTDEEAAAEAGPARDALEIFVRAAGADSSCLDCLSHRELVEFAGSTDDVKMFIVQSLRTKDSNGLLPF